MNRENEAARNTLLGLPTPEHYDLMYFDHVTVETLQKLVDLDVLELDDAQNDAPTAGEFMEYMRNHPEMNVTAHGYVVTPERDDYRVSIEGLNANPTTHEDLLSFMWEFDSADDMCGDEKDGIYSAYCWWD